MKIFLACYGVTPKACKPCRPQTKGKVERTVDYLKKNFSQRKHKPTWEALNYDIGFGWTKQPIKRKIKRHRNRRFRDGKRNRHSFNPGNETIIPDQPLGNTRGKLGLFHLLLRKEMLFPIRYAGQKVKLKVTLDKQLEIYAKQDCIAQHPIMTEKAHMPIQLEHYEKKKNIKKSRNNRTPLVPRPLISVFPPQQVVARSLAAYAALEGSDEI